MNILIINASPRRNGVTSGLLGEMSSNMDKGHVVETVRIDDLAMRPCIGCLKCRPDKPCILPPDGAQSLAEKIRWADLLVFGVPVYWGNMPGTLKIFFDRNVPLFEYCEARSVRYIPLPRLKGKAAMLVVTAGCPFPYSLLPSQITGTVRSLKTVLNAGGVKVLSVLRVSDAFEFEKKKDAYMRKAARLARSI